MRNRFENHDTGRLPTKWLPGSLPPGYGEIVRPPSVEPGTGSYGAGVAQIINDSRQGRPFGGEQAHGVLRDINLSPMIGGPSTTELTVIQGMWPPNVDGSALDGTPDRPQPSSICTTTSALHRRCRGHRLPHRHTDLSDTHLTALDELLNQIIEQTSANEPISTAADQQSDPGPQPPRSPK